MEHVVFFYGTEQILGETAYFEGEHIRQRKVVFMREREGGAIFFWPARKLCNENHKVKLDAQNPSSSAFATRLAASWRLRDGAMPRCRVIDEEGTIYAE